MDPEVFKLVEDKAQGNPLMIKEVCVFGLPWLPQIPGVEGGGGRGRLAENCSHQQQY